MNSERKPTNRTRLFETMCGENVADFMNHQEQTDYKVEPGADPPDLLFVSKGGQWPTLEVEVTSFPPEDDFTKRSDNHNLERLREQIERLLGNKVGFLLLIDKKDVLAWKKYEPRLANQIAAMFPILRAEIRQQKPAAKLEAQDLGDLGEYMHTLSLHTMPNLNSFMVGYLPRPFQRKLEWLGEAIERKHKLCEEQGRVNRTILIVGDNGAYRTDNIEEIIASVDANGYRFRQIWFHPAFDYPRRLK